MEIINSTNNPKVKYWAQLKSKKARETEGLYIIEGIKLIEEAITKNVTIDNLLIFNDSKYIQESQIEANLRNLPITYVSEAVIEKLADTETPQGIIAIAKREHQDLENLLKKNYNFYLLIDEIQDPGNLGTIIRSADAAGVDAIILGRGTVELYNPKVIRASMGSIFHLPIIEGDLKEVIPLLHKDGFNIIGTSPYASDLYFNTDLRNKIGILVGNESKGISKEVMNLVNVMVKIPIIGQAESLNVSMATSLVLYERVRQIGNIQK